MIRKLFIISLIWAVLILIVCAVPGNDLPSSPLFSIPNFDKLVHAGLYFPLAIFVGAEFDLSRKKWLHFSGPFLTLLIIGLYGGLIEILQAKLFINRSADFDDFLFDMIGGLGGLAIYYLFLRPFFRRLSQPRNQ